MTGRTLLATTIATMMLLALTPSATAHPAALPEEYESRLLHDHSDDWGGHAVTNDGHDLIALDLQELYLRDTDENAIRLQLYLNGGYAALASSGGTLRDVITMTAAGEPIEIQITTTDNEAFTTSLGTLTGPHQAMNNDGEPDGNRFTVDITLTYQQLGISLGDELAEFQVVGYADDAEADHMPGGDAGTLGADAAFAASGYTLQGPTMYLTLSALDDLTLEPGVTETRTVTVENLLDTNQSANWDLMIPDGLELLVDGADPEAFTLAAGETRDFEVSLTAGSDASDGSLRLELLSGLGGRAVASAGLTVATPQPADEDTTDASEPEPAADQDEATTKDETADAGNTEGDATAAHDHSDHDHDVDTAESPGAPMVLAALGVLAVAAVARRRA